MKKQGLVLIENDKTVFKASQHNYINEKYGITVSELLLQYKGFEGKFVNVDEKETINLYENNWGDKNQINIYKEKYSEKGKSEYKLLFLATIDEKNIIEPPQFEFAGFEYGYCVHEYSNYSSIFNEIIFGSNPSLTGYNQYLNQYYLINDESRAVEYELLHKKLCAKGEDVEEDEKMQIYKVWFYNS